MQTEQTLINRTGHKWIVEHRESERLTRIGGFLMTHVDLGCITMSTQLSEADKVRGREVLLRCLANTEIGTSGVRLWHPDKDDTDY